MTNEGMFDEIECKFELERQKKYIQKQLKYLHHLIMMGISYLLVL